MLRTSPSSLPVLALLALLSLSLAHANTAGDYALLDYWRAGLNGMDVAPPQSDLTPEPQAEEPSSRLSFAGHEGRSRTAILRLPAAPAGIVLHISDAAAAQAVPATDGHGHCVFAWSAGVKAGPESSFDSRQHPLYRAILDSCRLLETLTRLPRLQGLPVGVVGEGYGATVALAVAALYPEQVAFTVAHEPVCAGTAVREQAERAGVDLMLPSAGLKGLMRLSPVAFAPLVRAKTLMTVGLQDDLATPPTVVAAYDKLICDKRIISLEGIGHCPASDIPDWESIWRDWAYAPAAG